MSDYYYNGILLPEIPAADYSRYTYQMILKYVGDGSNELYVYASNTKPYQRVLSNVSRLELPGGRTRSWYTPGTGWSTANVGTSAAWCDLTNSWEVVWSNFNIPSGSASVSAIYFRGSQPTLTLIHLANQWNASIANDVAELTMTLNGCTPGNMLVLAYAVRGADNVITLSDGWTALGGGNNYSDPGASDQRIFFAYKTAESETETVTISQTAGKRIYAVCSEYFGVAGVKLRSDLAAIGTSNYTVAGEKTKAEDTMLYAVTSAYYGSGRNQTVIPADLDKIEGDSSAERLACWFDGGLGATSHTFQSHNSTEARDAVLECVQLVLYDMRYLIRSGTTLYTVTDGALSALTETEITASLFQTYGMDDLPDGALLATLTDPEVLYWQDSTDDLPVLTAIVTGVPPTPQVVVTDAQDMSDSTILGIESVTVDGSEDVLLAISFDDGATWKAYDGSQWATVDTENAGMTKTTMENISLEAWAEVVTSTAYRLRFVLMDTTSYVTEVVINYLN